MSQPKRQMRLGVSMIGLGYHVAAWRHPDVPAGGIDEVTMVSGAMTAIDNGFEAVRPSMSVSPTVKENVPTAVGLPLRAPLLDNARPGGSEPDTTDQVYGVTPPVPANVAE